MSNSALDAARQVLTQEGGPLHYKEITHRALASRCWQPSGKTPEATLNAQLAVNIKKLGDASPFRRVRPGVFALAGAPIPADMTPAKPKTPAASKGKTFSFTDAAEQVLKRFGNRQPMHYRDITAKALAENMLTTSGLTPDATMYAQIIQESQRRTRRGERQRFERYGKGMVGLSIWHGEGLALQIEQHNRDTRKKLHKQLKEMPFADFEELIGLLLAKIGFDQVEVTESRGDGGIDVRGTLVVGDVIRTRMAVQVKRWKANVQAPTVQQVRGSLGAHEQGLIITTSDFSKGARAEAERPDAIPVALMNGEQLVGLLVENQIGVARKPHELFELGSIEGDTE
jgi:restriction system protein